MGVHTTSAPPESEVTGQPRPRVEAQPPRSTRCFKTQVSERNYKKIQKECPKAALLSGEGMSAACKGAVKQMQDNLGGMFGYSLCALPHCWARVDAPTCHMSRSAPTCHMSHRYSHRPRGRYDDCIYDEAIRRRLREPEEQKAAPWRGGLNDYACPSMAMTHWLNRSDVRAALHIQPVQAPAARTLLAHAPPSACNHRRLALLAG